MRSPCRLKYPPELRIYIRKARRDRVAYARIVEVVRAGWPAFPAFTIADAQEAFEEACAVARDRTDQLKPGPRPTVPNIFVGLT